MHTQIHLVLFMLSSFPNDSCCDNFEKPNSTFGQTQKLGSIHTSIMYVYEYNVVETDHVFLNNLQLLVIKHR